MMSYIVKQDQSHGVQQSKGDDLIGWANLCDWKRHSRKNCSQRKPEKDKKDWKTALNMDKIDRKRPIHS